jgi:hypothetical protein
MGSRGQALMNNLPKGRPLAIDATAQSASPTEPAFVARPEGAPVYHGFVVLDDVTADGFTLGKISDFEAEPCDEGDAFVIAPGGSRAGLVWEVYDLSYFREVMPIEAGRWGVWGVGFRLPMNSRENARGNLESILPELKLRWAEWKSRFQGGGVL